MARMALIRFATAAAMLALSPAYGAGILPQSGQQQLDNATGTFLNAGKLYIYNPGTTTCASTFSALSLDPGTALPCPIILNSAGRIPAIYAANGSVRVRILNSASVLQFDQDNVAIVTAASTGGGGTPIPDSTQIWGTRDVKIRFDDQPLEGYVRMNGRTIGSASSGATERANADTESLFTQLWGFANVAVSGGKGGSASADWAANKTLVLPDMAGRLIGALDDLGNGAAGRLTSATIAGPTVAGAAGGAQTVTLDTTMIPAHTHASPALTDPGHTHSYTGPAANQAQSPGTKEAGTAPLVSGSSTTGITLAPTTGSTGGGLPSPNLPPVMLFTVYLKL